MRIYFIILFCFLSVFGYSQTGFPIEQNIGSKVTNTRTEGTFGSYTGFTFLKNYVDTTEANTNFYVRDTPGILIKVSDTLWIRNSTATAWLPIGSGGSAVSGADNGLSLSGSNIGLGGSTVSKVTNIWLRDYPIRFIRDSIQLSTQSDSNAIILSNRKPATATSDSLITPQIVFSVNGWQFNPGPTPDTSRNARFSISAVGADGANSYLALRGKAAGTSEINLLRIRANGGIIDNLYVNSQNIGIYGTNNLVFGSGGMGSTGITTSSVSGIDNQAIGIGALHSITSGSYSTAIGGSSLYNFKDGLENTALGYKAMFASDSTNYNTAIGSYSLFYNTSGYQLTAVGKNSLYSNTIGIKNTGIGAGAFEASDSGSFNSGVGHDIYYQLSIGDNNVGLGWRAGGSIVNGSNNIMIGTDAGFSASQQDTVDNTILIGYGLYSTKSNQMILGNSAITETQINGLSVGSSTDSVMVYDATNKIVKYRNASYFSGGGSYWPLGVGASLTSDVTMDVSSKVLQFGGIFSLFKQDDNNGRIDLVGTGRLLLQHDTVNLTTSLQAYDTTNNKPLLIDASGNIRKGKWFYAGTGGTGTNNTNGGSAYRWLLPGTQVIKTFSATSPLVLDSATSNQIGITINNAAADGSTKGAASFTASDFNSSSGNISIDYTNGQKATSSQPGFMTAAYAQKLDSNYYIQTPVVDNYLVGKKLNDSTLYIRKLLAGSNITLTLSGDTAISIASSGGGAGTNNANIGSGYRWLLPGTQEIKTAFAGLDILIDSSSNTNGLTFKADTATMFPQVRNTVYNTLNSVSNKGNETDTTILTAATISASIYGTVWSDNFARASLGSNYVNSAGSSTITFPSSAYMNLSGSPGATAWTNLIARTDSTNENKGSIKTTIVVNAKSATSYGMAIGWGNLNTLCCDHHVYGGVTLTTSTNNLFLVAESGNLVYTDAQALTIAAGDTITLELSQNNWTYVLTYYNYTTKVTRQFGLTGITQGSTLPLTPNGFSRPVFVHLGGDMRVYNFERVSKESKNARNVIIGNSLTLGGNITDPSQRYPYVATGNQYNTIISAGGGSVASYSNSTWTADLSRYAAGSAENFWLMCGGNDSLFSVWENQGKPAAIALRNRVVSAGKRFIWMTPMPRNTLNLSSVADTIIAIANRYGDPYLDFFHRFAVSSNQLPAPFNAGDGTHLTALANRWMGYYADSTFPQYTRQNSNTGQVKGYNGHFTKLSLTGRYEWNYTSTATTATIPNDASFVTINPSSTLATFTIQLPYVVDSGFVCYINFGGTLTSGVVVTALSFLPAENQSIVSMPFVEPVGATTPLPFGVGDMILCRYLSGGRWEVTPYRTGYYTDMYFHGHAIGTGAGNVQSNFRAGYASMNATTLSGANNTGLGNQALQLLTSGVRNTAGGSKALIAITTGNNNTAFGEEAAGAGNGSNRTAIGYASVFNATGSDNTGIGVNTFFSTTSGINNTGAGSGAGQNNVTGSGNTYIGFNSGNGVAANSNSNNTGVGIRSLLGITTGNRNVALGDSAAYTTTTGYHNTIIGGGATASSATAFDEVNIQNVIFATGANQTGTGAAGKVGIVTNRPTYDLDVNGTLGIRSVASDATPDSVLTIVNGQVSATASITSGNYTPTATGVSNYTSSANLTGKYTRIGNIVDVTISGTITPTATSSALIVGFSLPFASNFTGTYDCFGSGSTSYVGVQWENALVFADDTNDRAQMSTNLVSVGTNTRDFVISFKYEVK